MSRMREIICTRCGDTDSRYPPAMLCNKCAGNAISSRPVSMRSLLRDANNILREVNDERLTVRIKTHLDASQAFGVKNL